LLPARAQASRSDAREMIVSGARLPEAVNELSSLASNTQDAALVSEYSLALASSGLVEAALFQMDRAFVISGGDADEVLYAGSTLLAWLGLSQAADEIRRPAPSWVGDRALPLLSKPRKRSDLISPLGAVGPELYKAAELMRRSRFITALDRFSRLSALYPKDPLVWSGYAVALEKIGAYKTAAKAVAMELSTDTALEAGERDLLVEHIRELDERPPLEKKKLNEVLQGRYSAFVGGSLNGASGVPLTYSFSAQAGKFFTNYLNLSVDTAYSTSTHLVLGLGERLYVPMPITAPLSLTLGSRVEYDSTPSAAGAGNVGFVASPGLSYFIGTGSFDIFVDLGVAGSQKGTETLSVGYTFLMGGVK
jgi:tetratricopeptide (TPR) repeat protein